MRSHKVLSLVAALMTLGLLLAGCNKGGSDTSGAKDDDKKDSSGSSSGSGYNYGNDDDDDDEPAAVVAVEGDTVTAEGYAFSPKALKVKTGTTVKFVNKDSDEHTATSGDIGSADGKFDVSLSGNGEGTHTFSEAGTFKYFCKIHPGPAMSGTVEVS